MFPMRRPWLLFSYLCALTWAQSAGFTVEPAGNQNVDLATGIVTLPQGGRVVDPAQGIELTAPYLRYKEGELVFARQAKVVWQDTELSSGELNIDLAEQKAELAQAMAIEIPALSEVRAQAATVFLADGIAVLNGKIESDSPELSANQAIVDLNTQEVLLIGAFSYLDSSGLRLSGNQPDSKLYLKLGPGQTVSANTEVGAEIWERLSPYLETAAD